MLLLVLCCCLFLLVDGFHHQLVFVKSSGHEAFLETLEILYKGVQAYVAPIFEDNGIYKGLVDITTQEKVDIVTVRIGSRDGGQWMQKSHLTIYGANKNRILRVHGSHHMPRDISIILGYVVNESDFWQYTSDLSIPSIWYTFAYDDSEWESVSNYQSDSVSISTTQFFRKEFTISSIYPAYEVRIPFQYGMIVYLNEEEIIRENMSVGIVTPGTPAIGGYSSIQNRGYIRSGSELQEGKNLLAIEFHFINAESIKFHFKVWLSQLMSDDDSDCFTYPYVIKVTSQEHSTHLEDIVDFRTDTSIQLIEQLSSLSKSIAEISYSFTDNVLPYVSTFSIYKPLTITRLPEIVRIFGIRENPFIGNDFLGKTYNYHGEYHDYLHFPLIMLKSMYHKYRIELEYQNLMEIPELHFRTCQTKSPPILEYPYDFFTFIQYQSIPEIVPILSFFSDCSVDNPLPRGILISSDCMITGTPSEVGQFIITIRTQYPVISSTEISIHIDICHCSHVMIERTISIGSSISESVILYDLSNEKKKKIYEENKNVKRDVGIVLTSFCLCNQEYELVMKSANYDWWDEGSSIRILLDYHYHMVILFSGRYDTRIGAGSSIFFHIQAPIAQNSVWLYRMGSLPSEIGWEVSKNEDGWGRQEYGLFPTSSNQIQLYKLEFQISERQMKFASSLLFSIIFEYGCIAYLNGKEAYRWGIPIGSITNSTLSTEVRSSIGIHQFSLPIYSTRYIQSYIKIGMNMISIALFSSTISSVISIFDLIVRFQDIRSPRGGFAMKVDVMGFTSVTDIMSQSYFDRLESRNCLSKSITIQQEEGHAEWINRIVITENMNTKKRPHNVQIHGRISSDSGYELIKIVKLEWNEYQQSLSIWLLSETVYRSIRLLFVESSTSLSCDWFFDSIRLESIGIDVSNIVLDYDHVDVYDDHVDWVTPISLWYTDYQFIDNPNVNITINQLTGIISGHTKTTVIMTIQAVRIDLVNIITHIQLNRIQCDYNTHTITNLLMNSGEYSSVYHWIIQPAIPESSPSSSPSPSSSSSSPSSSPSPSSSSPSPSSSSPSPSSPPFMFHSSLSPFSFYSVTLCLLSGDNHLTFITDDNSVDNWSSPCGYHIRIMNHTIASGGCHSPYLSQPTIITIPRIISPIINPVSFSFLDFPSHQWTAVDYNDIDWPKLTCDYLSTLILNPTILIRQSLSINTSEHPVYIEMSFYFQGGLVIYYNSAIHTTTNMPEIWTFYSLSLNPMPTPEHHIVNLRIPFNEYQINQKHVIGIEYHMAKGHNISHSSPFCFSFLLYYQIVNPIVFDVQSYEIFGIHATSKHEHIFTISYWEYAIFYPSNDSYILWETYEDKPVSFSMIGMSTSSIAGLSMSLYGLRIGTENDWISIFTYLNIALISDHINWFNTPVGLLQFNSLRLIIDGKYSSELSFRIYGVFYSYDQPIDKIYCMASKPYESTYEEQYSVSHCPKNNEIGYVKRQCTSTGHFNIEDFNNCKGKKLNLLQYNNNNQLIRGIPISSLHPTIIGIPLYFDIIPSLPGLLSIDSITGSISGTSNIESILSKYTIYAYNQVSAISTVIFISIRNPHCMNEGIWGNVTIYTDSNGINSTCSGTGEIGIMYRECRIGNVDGEWQQVENKCFQPWLISVEITFAVILLSFLISPYLSTCNNPMYWKHRYSVNKLPVLEERRKTVTKISRKKRTVRHIGKLMTESSESTGSVGVDVHSEGVTGKKRKRVLVLHGSDQFMTI